MPASFRRPDVASPGVLLIAVMLVLCGLGLRISSSMTSPLWVDEAESSINGLTILERGYPGDRYLGLPLYENTLTEAWENEEEYEFRDSSYAARGMTVYHGWLPLYSIAAAQAVFGISPDQPQPIPAVRHEGQWAKRSIVPRLPALLYSLLLMGCVFALVTDWAGAPAGLAALAMTALSERAVFFGYQARYYAATLALSALVALALWWCVRRGRWRDFVLLGLAEGLLFHCHQVSALVFAAAALVAAPAMLRQSLGARKSLLALAVAAGLTVPWSVWSGFIVTAVAVPKVASLFPGGREWFLFVIERPSSLAVFLAAVMMLLAARLNLLRRWPVLNRPLQQLGPGAIVLVVWIAAAFLAVHLVIPAASYFPNRLTLMMQVPGLILVGAVLGALAHALGPRWAPAGATGLAIGLLLISDKLAGFSGWRLREETFAPPAARALATRTVTADTRFYASPNDQLLYAYLLGLPVQSIAPIRKTFLETYPGPIVFIESHHVLTSSLEARVTDAARAAGVTPAAGAVERWAELVWEHHAAGELESRALKPPPLEPLPAFLQPVAQHLREAEAAYLASARRRMPMFRDVQVASATELWLSFSYRFVNYADRLGRRANIHSRLQQATIELVPDAPAVIYHCPPLPSPGSGAIADRRVAPAPCRTWMAEPS